MTTQPLLQLDELKRKWIDDAFYFVTRQFPAGCEITSETIRCVLSNPPHKNWHGCLIAKLLKAGRIREIGRVKSSRPERNGAKITIWQTV
jgi:hypothetical protein